METFLKSDKAKLLLTVIVSLLILANTPIISTVLVVLLFTSSLVIIGAFLYSKYFDNRKEDKLADSIIKHWHKYTEVDMIITMFGLLFGGYYLTTILYCITIILMQAAYEAHKEG